MDRVSSFASFSSLDSSDIFEDENENEDEPEI